MLNINNTLDGFLKDVEIKGNTVQDAENLADIRSVGDKVEGQELYKIDVLSCGKNLCREVEHFGINISNGQDSTGVGNRTNYIRVKQGLKYTFSKNNVARACVKYYYNKNKEFISADNIITDATFTIPQNVYYLRLSWGVDIEEGNYQFEEGTVATPYEPYVEDKLTILSPVQLEKVGDVADRIVCKDGVWGVEKNVKDFIIPGGLKWVEYTTNIPSGATGGYVTVNLPDFNIIVKEKDYYAISDKNIILKGSSVAPSSSIGIFLRPDSKNIYIKDYVSNLEEMKLKYEGSLIKYPTTQPQFIPLPHDQQIKLRTFAGQTNIHFETEIQGTIKAQVPKSIGATVNTHTEQIGNLNKELDRVKKLEESTVSTVTTESDFTTVEETANGYFEDVKLEGKTLVNLISIDSYTYNDDMLRFYIKDTLTGGKTITLFNPTDKTIRVEIGCDGAWKRQIFLYPFSFKVENMPNSEYIVNISAPKTEGWLDSEEDKLKKCCLVLEGDHTQNPPSYFEGLMSVGQDVDEVSVLSCNENLFDKDNVNKLSNMWLGGKVDLNNGTGVISQDDFESLYWIKIEPSTTYTVQKMPSYRGRCGFSKNKPALGVQTRALTSAVDTFPMKVTSMSDENYLLISGYCDNNYDENLTEEELLSSIQINKGATLKPYTPHQSNKKPLLYYNNETQTWEKPILRQWDSIEKHSDGKYYYHKRSEEVVLNGSENWKYRTEVTDDGIHSIASLDTPFKYNKSTHMLCDTLNINSANGLIDAYSFGECLGYYKKITESDSHLFYLVLNKSKLSTQDVAGFKAWLQANPTTAVYQLAQEEVYECTNIDLITYNGETNYIISSGTIAPKSALKVHNNISNVVKILQEKVSLLESNVKASQEVQDMMILESDLRILDIELALMEHMPITLNLGENIMLRSATYFNFIKGHIVNETYSKEYLENVMNKYLATGRINQDEYDELYKMLYPPVYDIELPIEY